MAYDLGPGTYAPIGPEDIITGRSEVIEQPRTSMEVVEELHQLLQAGGIPGPYVLAGHSLGGFFSRLYVSTYPDEVVGMVLVDAFSERLETLLSPEDFASAEETQPGRRHRYRAPDSGLRRCRDGAMGR